MNKLSNGRHWLFAGATAVLLGYFMAWIPHEGAGLQIIGLEMGEWVKFLPEMQSGAIPASRHLFYLPPISTALILIVYSANWPNRRQTIFLRLLAAGLSLLIFPMYEQILLDPVAEWAPQIGMILLVAIVFFGISWRAYYAAGKVLLRGQIPLLILFALAGGLLPLWAFTAVHPAVSFLYGRALGVGTGLMIHLIGSTALVIGAILFGRQDSAKIKKGV